MTNDQLSDTKELSEDSTSVQIDPEAERKLLRKLDFTLLPLFTLICWCSSQN